MSVYRVRKIFDRRTNEKCDETRMCGQAAMAFVPTEKFMEMQKIRKTDPKKYDRWADSADWDDVWVRQEVLDPIIGQPVYFRSIKMDAGYFRCAVVEKVEQNKQTGMLTVTTCNSIYEVTLDD